MKKRYLKTKPVCKVTFDLPASIGPARQVSLTGDFNDWNVESTPMKRRKDGSFTVTVDLQRDAEYQFKYLIDGQRWENDKEADKYIQAPVGGGENSVIVV
ncbi:MAG: isoamylase early set domain-containing protein [Gammaproteobacteria bacterium]|jgi:1,4-alpha-glucan branching enzyme|nr:isoamylase early set domain-containing protein [Gammaproteobacteria bacterium]